MAITHAQSQSQHSHILTLRAAPLYCQTTGKAGRRNTPWKQAAVALLPKSSSPGNNWGKPVDTAVFITQSKPQLAACRGDCHVFLEPNHNLTRFSGTGIVAWTEQVLRAAPWVCCGRGRLNPAHGILVEKLKPKSSCYLRRMMEQAGSETQSHHRASPSALGCCAFHCC